MRFEGPFQAKLFYDSAKPSPLAVDGGEDTDILDLEV